MGERHIYFAWIDANADQVEYTTYNPRTKTDMEWVCNYPEAEIKLVKLWFGPNCGGWTFLRILVDRAVLAPREGKGFGMDGFTTDDDSMPIYINRKVRRGDRVGFQWKNLDVTAKKLYVQMEVETQSPKEGDAFAHRDIPDDVPGTTKYAKKKADGTVSPLDRDTGGW